MKISRLIIGFVTLIALVVASAYLLAVAGKAQTIEKQIKPDVTRALKAAQRKGPHTRKNSYQPSRSVSQLSLRPRTVIQGERQLARVARSEIVTPAATITGGTALTSVLHTSQLSMTSSAASQTERNEPSSASRSARTVRPKISR